MMDLLDLAPLDLRSQRALRYLGDDLCLPLSDFSSTDQTRIRHLYHLLEELFANVSGPSPEMAAKVTAFLTEHDIVDVINDARQIGQESYRDRPSPRMAKTIHDIRGGGLTPLLGHLQLLTLGVVRPVEPLYFLTRDHLKIMRNALLELDDAKRTKDLQPKLHSTDFIVEKWSGASLRNGDHEARLTVVCPLRANISECCVEFGALDRILYNLLNNACRHAADARIDLTILPIPSEHPANLRFVIANKLLAADAQHLATLDLHTLFEAGVSTTGSGYGLNVAAEFVANAFGLPDIAAAVEGGYLGARAEAGDFLAWFHWPTIGD